MTDSPRKLIPPIRVQADLARETSILFFPKDSRAPEGEYFMRGGIAWPSESERGEVGFALLGGVHVESGVLFIFEQLEWWVVEAIPGQPFGDLAHFFYRAWTTYYADTWYWRGDDLTKRQYLREVRSSKFIDPQPHLARVDWANDVQAFMALGMWGAGGKLVQRANAGLDDGGQPIPGLLDATRQHKADKERVDPPLEAMLALCAGLSKRPLWIFEKENK